MTSICRFSFALATSSHRAVSTRATAGLRTGWTNQCPPRDQYGAAGDLMVPLRTPRRPLTCDFRCAPGRNRTCDSRFRNQMQPPLPTCENTLNWAGDQAIHSRQDSSVTRRFPVFRGTTAGPTHRRLHTTTRDPASRLLRHPRGLGCLDPLRMPISLGGSWEGDPADPGSPLNRL
jgi:hypothetical protein